MLSRRVARTRFRDGARPQRATMRAAMATSTALRARDTARADGRAGRRRTRARAAASERASASTLGGATTDEGERRTRRRGRDDERRRGARTDGESVFFRAIGSGDRPTAVCLGKFDAMHRGHFALAEAAAARGEVVLVSFAGMAETLGWESRLPIMAPSDRTRVLRKWSEKMGGTPVREHSMAFKDVRELSPDAFVEMLARMGVGAVVAGENYKFGYKAVGDSAALKQFGEANGMTVDVVDLVPANTRSRLGLGDQVSSSRVRRALLDGNIEDVNWLLEREHRLVLDVQGERMQNALRAAASADSDDVLISLDAAENQPPNDGAYTARVTIDPSSDEDADVNAKTVDVKVSYGRIAIPRDDLGKLVFARERITVDFVERVSKVYAMGVSGRWG